MLSTRLKIGKFGRYLNSIWSAAACRRFGLIRRRFGLIRIKESGDKPPHSKRGSALAIRKLGLFLFVFLLAVDQPKADSGPDWLKAAVSFDTKLIQGEASLIVLLDEKNTRIKSNGDAEISYRQVIRILKLEGRAAAAKTIRSDSETVVSSLKAWQLRPDGKLIKLDKHSVSEESTDGLYSGISRRVVKFADVVVGSVVAFEWKLKQRPVANEDWRGFQGSSPVAVSRYRLSIPGDWKIKTLFRNHVDVAPVITGRSYLWEMKNLPALDAEPMMPDPASLAPQMAVSYFPPRGRLVRNSFSTWQDVSSWAARLMDASGSGNELVSARARELTSGLSTDMEKIRVLSRFVQDIRYVSIQLGSIGGYKPHPASVILKSGYGDCKDKAGLLRSLAASVGLNSYNVLVYSGDPTIVRADAPSVTPFNHSIIAISVNEDGPMVSETPRLGRLLFIDPTDELTPVGDLPFYLQGSYGLVVSKEAGALVKLPTSNERENTSMNEMSVDFTSNGALVASVKQFFNGQRAVQTRRLIASIQPKFPAEVERRAASAFPRSRVTNLTVKGLTDHLAPLEVKYHIEDAAPTRFSQPILALKPLSAFPGYVASFEARTRKHPVLLEMRSSQEDRVTLGIPPNYKVDELPPDVEKDTSVGRIEIRYKVENRKVIVRRRIVIRESIVKPEDCAQLTAILDAATASTSGSIVLVRDNSQPAGR